LKWWLVRKKDEEKGRDALKNVEDEDYEELKKILKTRKPKSLHIQLRKFAVKNHLPMTLFKGQEGLYKFFRGGVVCGLSDEHHRENTRGKIVIQKLFYDKIIDVDLLPINPKTSLQI
jgi:hypothetical protein